MHFVALLALSTWALPAPLSPISVISEEGLGGGGGGLGGTKREERAALAVAITMKVRARLMVQ